jgi:CheY-like chemotaxis protein
MGQVSYAGHIPFPVWCDEMDVIGQMKPGNACAVLLVDDNPVQAAIRQTILRRAGYFVIAVLNPMRALEQLQDHDFPSEISAIITDHIMPGMSGSRFVREVRKSRPQLPVVVITGMQEAEVEYAGMNVLFLQKPLAPDLLLSNLRDLLESRQQGAA